MKHCKFAKKDNNFCKAPVLTDDEFCFWHSPKVKKQRHQAVSDGGQATRKYELEIPDWEYENSKSVIQLLELCINKTIQGSMPSRIANSIAYLSNAMLTAVKETEMEQRLEVIEYALKIKEQDS